MADYCEALAGITGALPSALGDDFQSLYLYEGLDRDLWLFVRPETDMGRVRRTLLPLWNRYAIALGRKPVAVSSADFAHYRLLFPSRARDLCQRSRLLVGEDIWARWQEPPPADPAVQLARVAAQAVSGCALLELDEPDANLEKELFWVVTHEAQLDIQVGALPLEVLAALYAHLAVQSQACPGYHWDGLPPAEPAPSLLPGLLALVGLRDQLIGVMPYIDRSILAGTDWSAVTRLVSDEFAHVGLATPWQLRLAASTALAQDLYLRTFELLWGSDVLSDCVPSEYHVLRNAAELPVRVLVEQLSPAYLTAPEEELDGIIHRTQNALLNIQLRSELTARLQDVPADLPPEPLPDRDSGPHQRIAANYRHLRWWSDHFVTRWQALRA